MRLIFLPRLTCVLFIYHDISDIATIRWKCFLLLVRFLGSLFLPCWCLLKSSLFFCRPFQCRRGQGLNGLVSFGSHLSISLESLLVAVGEDSRSSFAAVVDSCYHALEILIFSLPGSELVGDGLLQSPSRHWLEQAIA